MLGERALASPRGRAHLALSVGMLILLGIAAWVLRVPGRDLQAAEPNDDHAAPASLYMPLVMRNYPPQPTIFGVEVSAGKVPAVVESLPGLAPSWIRVGAALWSAVEPQPGTYNWDALERLEEDLRLASANGLVPIVPVKWTPPWAQKVPGYPCGPIKEEALDDFAAFMEALVRRYSGPPYNVRYWEIWNEPDAAYQLVPPEGGYGCLGDAEDPYYGGGEYATLLKAVYPAIKAANPTAQVVFGGLLLDCDPTRPPQGKDCTPARFLEGALRAGGGAYFDILAYHAYPHWFRRGEPVDWDLNHFAWRHRGGILLGKLDFLREVMGRYGVDKPVFMNEGGLLCHPTTPDCNEGGAFKELFHQDQANYAVRLFMRGWAAGLKGITWYTLNGPGWREGGLLDENQKPRPAYRTLRFLVSRFRDARYVGEVSRNGVEGYAFQRGDTRLTVYWRNDGMTTPVALPSGVAAVYNYRGEPITGQVQGNTIFVGFEPVIVESTGP